MEACRCWFDVSLRGLQVAGWAAGHVILNLRIELNRLKFTATKSAPQVPYRTKAQLIAISEVTGF